MTRLEKSIRHELAPYGPALRAGHYNAPGYTGFETKRGTIAAAYCDVENGIVTDIRFYGFEGGKLSRDYHGKSCDISSAFYNADGEGFLYSYDWESLIDDIVSIVTTYKEQKEQERDM